jgi:hypothetical protein
LYAYVKNNPQNLVDPLGLWGDWGPNAVGPGENGGFGYGWGNQGWGGGAGSGWGNGYGYGNNHVGYDGGATSDIRLPDGTIIIVDWDAGGIVTDVSPGREGQVSVDLTPPPTMSEGWGATEDQVSQLEQRPKTTDQMSDRQRRDYEKWLEYESQRGVMHYQLGKKGALPNAVKHLDMPTSDPRNRQGNTQQRPGYKPAFGQPGTGLPATGNPLSTPGQYNPAFGRPDPFGGTGRPVWLTPGAENSGLFD